MIRRAVTILLLSAAVAQAAGAKDRPLRVGGDVLAPVAIKRVSPEIPKGTRAGGIIILEGVVTVKGDLREIRVIRGAADPLTPRVVAALKQWKFRPATKNGKPVEVYYTMTAHPHPR